ncbi:MAG: hypothetical protein JJE03_04730 [Peptostreptococcaceae bacterium]|nr:hypothetical protein [Peptostreptococcaceae bacterium]
MTKVLFENEQSQSNEEINEALASSNKFKGLRAQEKLEVLVEDVIRNSNVNKANYEIWKEEMNIEDKMKNISDDFKIKQIIKVLASGPNTEKMETLVNVGILEFCLPKLFTKINKNTTSYLMAYCKNVEKIEGTPLDKLVLLLAIFPVKEAVEAVESLDIKEDKELYIKTLEILEEFTIINEKPTLKKFILTNGMKQYEYLFALSGNFIKAYEFPKYRYLSKKYLLDEIRVQKEPIFPEDLDITREDLIESGLADEDSVDELMMMLAEHLINKPFKNNKEELLKIAKKMNDNKIFKYFRRVNWIR